MPRLLKAFIHDAVYELCFRTEEGLPFSAASFMKRLVEGCMAAAQTKYPVTICNYIVMANHVHMMIRVLDPEDVSRFIRYFKGETAHIVNRLLGRRNRTVWSERYDSPIILDAEKCLERISYFYLNPVRAGLTSSIDDYPNLSSWKALIAGGETRICQKFSRRDLPELEKDVISKSYDKHLNALLDERKFKEYSLVIDPYAWMKAFVLTEAMPQEKIQKMVMDDIRSSEAQKRKDRKGAPLGADTLIRHGVSTPHTPKSYGKKMICLGSTKHTRNIFITFFREMMSQARSAVRNIRRGAPAKMPPSFYHPGGYLLANILPMWTPLPLG